MADKFLNLTAVQAIKTWATGLFAKDADLDTLSGRVDDIIAEGGEPNVIEIVKKNGTALTPDVNKAVDISVPTIAKSGSGETEKVTVTEGQNSYDVPTVDAMEDYVGEHGGVIQKVKLAGTDLDIDSSDKSVNIPTATDSANGAMSATDKTKLDGIEAGAEENTINSISVNDTEQTIDANKNVNLIIPEQSFSSLPSGTKMYSFGQNKTGGSKLYISEYPEGINTFPTIKKPAIHLQAINNGTEHLGRVVPSLPWVQDYVSSQTPTNVSDLTNDSGYQTASDVQSAIASGVASVVKLKGSVATYADLPSTGNVQGDMYDTLDTGRNYVWIYDESTQTGRWDDYAGTMDLSAYWISTTGQSNTLEAATVSEINAILNA